MTANIVWPERHGKLSASEAFQLALHFHKRGNLAEAATLYRRVLSIVPDHFGALCGLGMINSELGQLDEGLSAFCEAARLAHGSVDADAGIELIVAAIDRREEAVELIEPETQAARLGRDDAAIAIEEPPRVPPAFAKARDDLAKLLKQLGRYESAKAALDELSRRVAAAVADALVVHAARTDPKAVGDPLPNPAKLRDGASGPKRRTSRGRHQSPIMPSATVKRVRARAHSAAWASRTAPGPSPRATSCTKRSLRSKTAPGSRSPNIVETMNLAGFRQTGDARRRRRRKHRHLASLMLRLQCSPAK